MAFISQQILSLLDGVSQQPDKLRSQSEGEAQVNVYDSIVHGKMKRPPTRHIAQLSSTPWTPGGLNGVYIWPVNRDATERYHIVVNSEAETIQVFDANTGQQYNVLTPQGTSYLAIEAVPQLETNITSIDTFTGSAGTAIESHISNSSEGWTFVGAYGNAQTSPNGTSGLVIETNPFQGIQNTVNHGTSTPGQSTSMYNLDIPVNNYTASMTWETTTTPLNYSIGLVAKAPSLTPFIDGSSNHFIAGGYSFVAAGSSGSITVGKIATTGSVTTLHTFTGLTLNTHSTQYTLSVSFSGSVMTVSLNGTVLGTVTDTTYSAGGFVGIGGIDTDQPGGQEFVITGLNISYVAEVNVETPLQYGFKFTTVQDTTFVVNQSKTVLPSNANATPTRPFEALVAIKTVDYGTDYTVVLNGITLGFTTTNANAPNAREQLTTDDIAANLASQITSNATLNAVFEVEVFGSTIYLTTTNGSDFTLTVSDGLADTALVAVKTVVQAQSYLPARALNGFVVEVQPDPDNQFDATYYIYDDLGQPSQNGIWRECTGPGLLTTLDNTTMPWTLVKQGDVVAGFPADGGPTIAPIIGPDITQLSTFSYANDSGGAASWGDQGAQHTWTLTNADGAADQFATVQLSVAMGNLPQGEYAYLTFTNNVNSSSTTFTYLGGTQLTFAENTVTLPLPGVTAGTVVTGTMFYSRGATPPSDHQGVFVVPAMAQNGFVLSVPDATAVSFNSNESYPQGVTYTLVVGADTVHYTSTVDQTNVQLAVALAGLTYTGYTASNPFPGTVSFKPSSGSAPTVTYSNNWNQSEDYHNGNLNLAPGELVGFFVQDLSDGSSGTVTANTSTTITVGAGLTGGINNKFLKNHLVSVTGPAGFLFFVFQPVNWSQRAAGDDITNPFPSFTFSTINEVGFASGRLIFTSGENLITSGANDVFNFFRTSVVSLLDSDRIDVSANSDTVSDWHSIVHWAEGCWLWAANVQAQLPTQPALSNSTVSIVPSTRYPSSPQLRPLAMDRRIYFARERTGQMPVTQIFRYQRIRFPFTGFIAEESTKKIPTYIQGSPLQLVGDPSLEFMLVLTDFAPNQLYPYVFHYTEDQQLQQESWSTWEFDPLATILSMDCLDGHIGLIISRPDGVYLEDIDMEVALYDNV